MMPKNNRVRLVFAPLPDEQNHNVEMSAAFQFAHRAQQHFIDKGFEADVSMIQQDSFANTKKEACACLVIVSCAADGSIHRLLRKATKSIATAAADKRMVVPVAVALLGHAKCETSAKQMKETIFASGRRIAKNLETTSLEEGQNGMVSPLTNRLETQVELVGPEQDFDPWIESVISTLHKNKWGSSQT